MIKNVKPEKEAAVAANKNNEKDKFFPETK